MMNNIRAYSSFLLPGAAERLEREAGNAATRLLGRDIRGFRTAMYASVAFTALSCLGVVLCPKPLGNAISITLTGFNFVAGSVCAVKIYELFSQIRHFDQPNPHPHAAPPNYV